MKFALPIPKMAIAQIGVFPGSFFEEILNSHMKIHDLGCINHSKNGRSCDLTVDLTVALRVAEVQS